MIDKTPENMAKLGSELSKAFTDTCRKAGLTPPEAINAALLTAAEIAFSHIEPPGTMADAFAAVKGEFERMHQFAIEFGNPKMDKPEAN